MVVRHDSSYDILVSLTPVRPPFYPLRLLTPFNKHQGLRQTCRMCHTVRRIWQRIRNSSFFIHLCVYQSLCKICKCNIKCVLFADLYSTTFNFSLAATPTHSIKPCKMAEFTNPLYVYVEIWQATLSQ